MTKALESEGKAEAKIKFLNKSVLGLLPIWMC